MQGHFCFIKSPIFAFLPDIDMSATCWIFDKACSSGSEVNALRQFFSVQDFSNGVIVEDFASLETRSGSLFLMFKQLHFERPHHRSWGEAQNISAFNQ